jgi:hypothetical protein
MGEKKAKKGKKSSYLNKNKRKENKNKKEKK